MDLLEQKRLEIIDINKQSFSPQKLMADRDVEKEKLIRSNKFYDMLLTEWDTKTKEEKTRIYFKIFRKYYSRKR